MKRRILLVDDEVAVLLTLKAVLEISGFEVETAASAKEAKSQLKKNHYSMIITDMRMEYDEAGREVVQMARQVEYHPAIALLTAFPVAEEDWQEIGADHMLVKPMQTKILLQQIEGLLASHEAKLAAMGHQIPFVPAPAKKAARKTVAKKPAKSAKKAAKKAAKKVAAKVVAKKTVVKRVAKKVSAKKTVAKKIATKGSRSR